MVLLRAPCCLRKWLELSIPNSPCPRSLSYTSHTWIGPSHEYLYPFVLSHLTRCEFQTHWAHPTSNDLIKFFKTIVLYFPVMNPFKASTTDILDIGVVDSRPSDNFRSQLNQKLIHPTCAHKFWWLICVRDPYTTSAPSILINDKVLNKWRVRYTILHVVYIYACKPSTSNKFRRCTDRIGLSRHISDPRHTIHQPRSSALWVARRPLFCYSNCRSSYTLKYFSLIHYFLYWIYHLVVNFSCMIHRSPPYQPKSQIIPT